MYLSLITVILHNCCSCNYFIVDIIVPCHLSSFYAQNCHRGVQYFHVMFPAYMRIKIPWKNLSTEQTVIELEGVYVVVVPYLSM